MKLPPFLPSHQVIRKPIICADGTSLHIGASPFHACYPQKALPAEEYAAIEIIYILKKSSATPYPSLLPYRSKTNNNLPLYEYVPIDLLSQLIAYHGGESKELSIPLSEVFNDSF